jgi:hypothetical protein
MPATYEPIATTTLGSAAANIEFTSIPGTYTDLLLTFFIADFSATGGGVRMQFNSDTASNYSQTSLRGSGSAASSANRTSQNEIEFNPQTMATGFPRLIEVDLLNYAGSTFKTSLYSVSSDQNGAGNLYRGVGLWRSTSAITSIKLYDANAVNFAAGTMATLYGILKA